MATSTEGGDTIQEDIRGVSVPVPGDFDDPETYRFPQDDDAPDKSLVRPEDIEKIIPDKHKPYLEPGGMGYWLEEGFSFALIYRDRRSNEYRYYVIEPHIDENERVLIEYLNEKLRDEIEYDDIPIGAEDDTFERIIQRNFNTLLRRFSLIDRGALQGNADYYSDEVDAEDGIISLLKRWAVKLLSWPITPSPDEEELENPEGKILSDSETSHADLTDQELKTATNKIGKFTLRQADKILYELSKEYLDYKKITPLLSDVNIEDISVDGYHEPVWIYHSNYGDLKTNLSYAKDDLDNIVKYIAESDGRGISKRQPTVNATLADGSRAQLTLANEVSEKGTNFTIRLYRDVPFTPIDLINWETFDIDEMAYLWLCVENDQKILFCGGTGAGKTTSLNAASLFIPKEKIVSIEDTPELTIPHENWVPMTTRENEMTTDSMDYEMFDLVEEAMRQRPSYMLVGEVRNTEAANALFQTIETGHTSFSTFHADSVAGVINRFTNDPINIAPPQFRAIDLIVLQEQLVIDGKRMRRAKSVTEIGEYNQDDETIDRNRVYEYDPATDQHVQKGTRNIMEDIRHRNGWSQEELHDEFARRKTVLSYLIRKGIQDYGDVAAVIQAYMRDPKGVLALIAHERLEHHLEDLQKLDSLDLSVDEKEEEKLVRPQSPEMMAEAEEILTRHWDLVVETENYNISEVFAIGDNVQHRDARYPFGEQFKEAQEAAADEQERHDDSRFGVKDADTQDHFDAMTGQSDGTEPDSDMASGADPTAQQPSDEQGDATASEADSDDADNSSGGFLARVKSLFTRSSGDDQEDEQESAEPDTQSVAPPMEEEVVRDASELDFDEEIDLPDEDSDTEEIDDSEETAETDTDDEAPIDSEEQSEPSGLGHLFEETSDDDSPEQRPQADGEETAEESETHDDTQPAENEETSPAETSKVEAAPDSPEGTPQDDADSEPNPVLADDTEDDVPSADETTPIDGAESPTPTADGKPNAEPEHPSNGAGPGDDPSHSNSNTEGDSVKPDAENPFATASSGQGQTDTSEEEEQTEANEVSESNESEEPSGEEDPVDGGTVHAPAQTDDPFQPDISEEDVEQFKSDVEDDEQSGEESSADGGTAHPDPPSDDPFQPEAPSEDSPVSDGDAETDSGNEVEAHASSASPSDSATEDADALEAEEEAIENGDTVSSEDKTEEELVFEAEPKPAPEDSQPSPEHTDSLDENSGQGTDETEVPIPSDAQPSETVSADTAEPANGEHGEDSAGASEEHTNVEQQDPSQPVAGEGSDSADEADSDQGDRIDQQIDDPFLSPDELSDSKSPSIETEATESVDTDEDSHSDEQSSTVDGTSTRTTADTTTVTETESVAEDDGVDGTEQTTGSGEPTATDTGEPGAGGEDPEGSEHSIEGGDADTRSTGEQKSDDPFNPVSGDPLAPEDPDLSEPKTEDGNNADPDGETDSSDESGNMDETRGAAGSAFGGTDGNSTDSDRGFRKEEQNKLQASVLLEHRDWVGESPDDVEIDQDKCLKIVQDERYGELYKQCQNQVNEGENFCDEHGAAGSPQGGDSA